MSKSGKSKSKSRKAEKAKAGKAGPARKGRLVALEGAAGRELEFGAERLVDLWGGASAGVAVSRWDASNTFFELRLGKGKLPCPPLRTLLLLYASDLLFRLRWEIRPALAEGRTLVAAPYLETAIGFGIAAGLPREWLEELFSFAPKPCACFRVKEKVKAKHKRRAKEDGRGSKSANGFVEYCSRLMAASSPRWDVAELRARVLEHLNALEENGGIFRLGKKLPKHLPKN